MFFRSRRRGTVFLRMEREGKERRRGTVFLRMEREGKERSENATNLKSVIRI